MRRHAERQAYSGANYLYAASWDADKIVGCDCDPEAGGYDCRKQLCPRGDDPMTQGQVDEVQLVSCTMAAPSPATFFTLTVDDVTSRQIATDAPASDVRSALVELVGEASVVRAQVGTNTTFCSPAGEMHLVTFIQRHGDVPALRINADVGSTAPGASFEVVDATSSNASITAAHPTGSAGGTFTAIAGSKEWSVCSGRGTCDEGKGVCSCFTGFDSSNGFGGVGARGDCGYAAKPITSCPGLGVECTGHGACSGHPEYRCTCDRGWVGGDCALRSCPTGRSWFDAPTADETAHAAGAECSNRGVCDRETSRCACHEGFTGEGCERLDCPKGAGGRECSGHGRCASMAQLAADAETNGVPTPFRYGSPAMGISRAWDSRAVFGCACDDGFEGHACSQRSCPVGDDPHTPGRRETQSVNCTGTAGSFTLGFRGEATAAIPAAATPAQLKAAFEAMSTVESVRVACASTAAVCAAGGNACLVEFMLPLGDLPTMTASAGTGLSVAVAANGAGSTVNGTTESAECSNRGICDLGTGTCSCFLQHGSSDGTNSPGTRGDCGYVEPFVPVGRHGHNPWEQADKMWRLRGSWTGSAGAGGAAGAGSKGEGAAQGMLARWMAKA